MNIQHDGTLVISTGRSANEINWKNRKVRWSDLASRLANTYRTAETVNEYSAMTKDQQGAVKDIGGFVGGLVKDGRRTVANVQYRCLLSLDIDYADRWFWQDFKLQYQCAAVLYSTHKHTPASARYRLVIPLSRQVGAEEYEAVARMVASCIDMELFDPTTFQVNRLMYWPSTSQNGEYEYRLQDGPWLNPDSILALYADWQDNSTWPVHTGEERSRRRSASKQGEPTDKPGIVGAFCRTYTITEAIEKHLPEAYVPCDHMPGRFTYTGGSTSAGLVLYEDKFAYSHHSTDPACGKLCNAFDLVRLHLFGAQDEDVEPGTPVNRLPSYRAMLVHAASDGAVKRLLGRERLQRANADFVTDEDEEARESGEESAEDAEWMEKLEVNRQGECDNTIDNVIIILSHDPRLKDRFGYDEFSRQRIIKKSMPWRKIKATDWWGDKDDAGLRHYLEKVYTITAAQKINDGLGLVMWENRFHPVLQYLDTLQWDGQRRVEELLIDYLGAEDTPYVRAVTRKCLTAAVARVYEPGCKYDYVLTLVGKEGQGKSTLWAKLAGKWFSDNFAGVNDSALQKTKEQMAGVWIMEIAELDGLRKAEVESIKHFVSQQIDSYRPAYGHNVEHFPRSGILVGTSNEEDGFLRDQNGDRRFWPVATGKQEAPYGVFDDLLPDEVNQIWAEAKYLYENGEALFLPPELEAQARQMQQHHKVKDERTGIIEAFLAMPLPQEWKKMSIAERRAYLQDDELRPSGTACRSQVCVAEIWCEVMGGNIRDMTAHNTKQIHAMLKRIPGWEPAGVARFSIYGRQRAYVKIG